MFATTILAAMVATIIAIDDAADGAYRSTYFCAVFRITAGDLGHNRASNRPFESPFANLAGLSPHRSGQCQCESCGCECGVFEDLCHGFQPF